MFLGSNKDREAAQSTKSVAQSQVRYEVKSKVLSQADAKDLIKNGVAIVPEGYTEIGERAFFQKSLLEEVILPSSIKTIGKEAFYACIELRAINLTPAMGIDGRAFYFTKVKVKDIINACANDSATKMGQQEIVNEDPEFDSPNECNLDILEISPVPLDPSLINYKIETDEDLHRFIDKAKYYAHMHIINKDTLRINELILEYDGRNIEALNRIGRCYYDIKAYEKALEVYKQALLIDRTNIITNNQIHRINGILNRNIPNSREIENRQVNIIKNSTSNGQEYDFSKELEDTSDDYDYFDYYLNDDYENKSNRHELGKEEIIYDYPSDDFIEP